MKSLRSDVKKNLDDFKQEINQKFARLSAKQQLYSGTISEVEVWLEKLENWAIEANCSH